MKKLDEKYIKVLEENDYWRVGYTDDGKIELETFSPAGEDFVFMAEVEDFPESEFEYAMYFDIDEHIEMWIEARNNGVTGVPSVRRLVDDAEAIDEMLMDLAMKLRKVA